MAYTMHCGVRENSDISKNKSTSGWNRVFNSERSRDFSAFRHGIRRLSRLVSLVRPSQVYYAERRPLFATDWQRRAGDAERRAVRLRQLRDLSTV